MKEKINLVWLKRDLRNTDHEPAYEACLKSNSVVFIYIFDSAFFEQVEYNQRHFNFICESLTHLKYPNLWVFKGNTLNIFESIFNQFDVVNLFSYAETGLNYTWNIDKQIKNLTIKYAVSWSEFQYAGVKRGRYNRSKWGDDWVNTMLEPQKNPIINKLRLIDIPLELRNNLFDFMVYSNNRLFQPGGENYAQRYLNSFFEERINLYSKNISKPALSRQSCSRLSPYLAWGNISMRQVWQASMQFENRSNNLFNLRSFRSRLFWHCHFIQKFEREKNLESENFNKAFNQINKIENDRFRESFENAKTGYPLVDACIRCLKETGYLNFRMRAMLVSFASHNLWLPWQKTAHFLAQNFLDFEPGIHYPQVQMQSFMVGTHTLRIYNIIKQSLDQDFKGEFIKKWVPELIDLPPELIHEPYNLSIFDSQAYNFFSGISYPKPIVDYKETSNYAKKILIDTVRSFQAQKENNRILSKHNRLIEPQ